MKIKLILMILLGVMTACSSLDTKDRLSRLETSANSYGAAIRWARYRDVYEFHLAKDGFRPKLELEDYEGIRVTGYQIIEKTLNTEQTEATVVAVINFYNDDYGTVSKMQHTQNWWYSEDSKRWLVDANLPKFK